MVTGVSYSGLAWTSVLLALTLALLWRLPRAVRRRRAASVSLTDDVVGTTGRNDEALEYAAALSGEMFLVGSTLMIGVIAGSLVLSGDWRQAVRVMDVGVQALILVLLLAVARVGSYSRGVLVASAVLRRAGADPSQTFGSRSWTLLLMHAAERKAVLALAAVLWLSSAVILFIVSKS